MASTAITVPVSSSSIIEQIFTCAICLGKVKNAQMCPSCSNMCCLYCIKRWLSERHQCPHCRASLRSHQLVPCRFVAEISAELEKLQHQMTLSSTSLSKHDTRFSKEHRASSLTSSTPLISPRGHFSPSQPAGDVELCPLHNAPLYYFCITCDIAICSDCAMFGGDRHREHKFEHLASVYARHVDTVRAEAAHLRTRLCQLSEATAAIELNIERVGKAKDERAAELRHALDAMLGRLDHQLKQKLAALLAEKGKLCGEIEVLESTWHQVHRQLKSEPKSHFIAKSGEIVKLLRELSLRTTPSTAGTGGDTDSPNGRADDDVIPELHSLKPLSVSCDFASEIVPAYEGGQFRLPGYVWLVRNAAVGAGAASATAVPRSPRGGGPGSGSGGEGLSAANPPDTVYSELLTTQSGQAWRLKVYPSGNGSVKGTYLSVFLEMVRNVLPARDELPSAHSFVIDNTPSTTHTMNNSSNAATSPAPSLNSPPYTAHSYDYKVELVNHLRSSQAIVREFSSEFEAGECWGYNRFARIEELLRPQSGFLDATDDALHFRFWVRPPTFAQLCRDQRRYIEKLEEERKLVVVELSDLRSRLAREASSVVPRPSAVVAIPHTQPTKTPEHGDHEDEWEEGEVRLPTNQTPSIPAGAVPTPMITVDRSVSFLINNSPKRPAVPPLPLEAPFPNASSQKSAGSPRGHTTSASEAVYGSVCSPKRPTLATDGPHETSLGCSPLELDHGLLSEIGEDEAEEEEDELELYSPLSPRTAESFFGASSAKELTERWVSSSKQRSIVAPVIPANGSMGFVHRYAPQQLADVATSVDSAALADSGSLCTADSMAMQPNGTGFDLEESKEMDTFNPVQEGDE